jgi:hypothetical protein
MKNVLTGAVAVSSLLLAVVLALPFHVSASGKRTPTPTPTVSGLPAPSPLAPANGAQVTVPFTMSWSAVSDPRGIVAYNWQISPSSTFSPVIQLNSTSGQTQDTVSGLANGTYFWRVQAVNGDFIQGAWSSTRSFTVTGANSGAPGAPALNPPKGGTAFHPMEVISFIWSAVAGAASYTLDASNDPNFPVATRVHFDNIPNTAYSLQLGDSMPQGTWYVRVSAVNANGIQGVPSNSVTFTLSFNAPLPPAPTPLSPANGATVALPVTLSWTDVPNPQPSGYVLEVASDSAFSHIEYINNQITGPSWTITSLSAGTKYWHVLSTQGDSAPGVPANTAWSAIRSFIVPSTPPGVGSLAVAIDPASNDDTQTVSIQLTGPALQGGAVVSLSSSNPTAAPVPATFTIPAGFAFGQFRFQVGSVSSPTAVTLTATLNATSASVSFSVQPPALKSISVFSPISGGATTSVIVMLTGAAPSGGAVVSLSSSSPAASPPPTATIAAGDRSVSLNMPTSAVTSNTMATISATWNGQTVQTQLTLTPQQPPASLTLSPNPTIGSNGSFGTVTVASPASSDLTLQVTCSNPSVATCNTGVTIPAGSTTGGFNIFTVPVTTQALVTVSVSGAGVTRTATLTIQPSGAVATPTPTSPPATPTSPAPPTPPPATPTRTPTPPVADTVAIQVAEYASGNRQLRVEASSSSASATLQVFVTSTNTLIGTLQNDGGGRYRSDFSWPSNPQNITVRSSLGGSATKAVTVK